MPAIPPPAPEDPEARRRRLRWRCRRGMLELDELFITFLDRGYDKLNDSERDTFERMLESKDQDLLDWMLLQAEPEDGDYRNLVDKIRNASLC